MVVVDQVRDDGVGGGVDGVQRRRSRRESYRTAVPIYRVFVYTGSVSTRVAAHVLIETR